VTAHVLRGDARRLPLADSSVDLICTSPPYYALRSYTDGGQHYDGQIGSEPTPGAYIDNLIACTAEWMRVLKPTGSLWVNLGDKYAERGGPERDPFADGGVVTYRAARPRRRGESETGVRQKSLMGLPWRYALRCIDDLGLILRAEIIWSKPNGLPESVTDRVRRSHEQWFHLVKQPRYYSAIDRIRQPHQPDRNRGKNALAGQKTLRPVGPNSGVYHPLGALPGSVWEIPTEPLTVPDHLGVDHFAAFPTEWPRRIILGWSPTGICTTCGEGRRPDTNTTRTVDGHPIEGLGGWKRGGVQIETAGIGNWRFGTDRTITGEACGCPDTTAPTQPAVVLDPFGGTGTVALVAHTLGRTGLTVDMSADYCRLAAWRTTDRGELAKAMRVDKPPKQVAGQADLFADLEEPACPG
jgi:DNA modification methylase